MSETEDIVTMYELADAVDAAIKAADPATREALARTVDAYHKQNPEDFHWALSGQAPILLHQLMWMINCACRPEATHHPTVTRPGMN
jgi:hypothetical protein